MQISRTELVLHRVINDALREFGPELLPQGPATYEAFVARSREEEGLGELVHEDDFTINVEGAAFREDGSLLVGLRYPVEAEGRPILTDVVGIERLFEGGTPEVTGFTWADAVGREGTVAGVRDLAIVGDELHLVTGNIDSKQKGSVVLEGPPRRPGHGGDPLPLQAAGGRSLGASRSRLCPRVPEPAAGGRHRRYG